MRGTFAQGVGRLILTGIVMGAGIATALFGPTRASADIDYCRTDPIITVINADGSTTAFSVGSNVYTSASNISAIYYDIHIPASARSWTVSTVGDVAPEREVVTVTADTAVNRYISTIAVISSVTATVQHTAAIGTSTVSRSATTRDVVRLRLDAPSSDGADVAVTTGSSDSSGLSDTSTTVSP